MADPVTIGTLAAAALAAAGDGVVKASVGEVVKDAYKALKGAVAAWAKGDVEALEAQPTPGRQIVVAEAIDARNEDDRAKIQALIEKLQEALRTDGPVGLEVAGKLDAFNVQLGSITVREGTGAKFGDVMARGDFKAGDIDVGSDDLKKN